MSISPEDASRSYARYEAESGTITMITYGPEPSVHVSEFKAAFYDSHPPSIRPENDPKSAVIVLLDDGRKMPLAAYLADKAGLSIVLCEVPPPRADGLEGSDTPRPGPDASTDEPDNPIILDKPDKKE